MGKNAYLTESWEEIVRRIDAEDRAAGKKVGGPTRRIASARSARDKPPNNNQQPN
jgi:hypothetical protein